LALDADPAPLTDYLAQRAPFGHRLGIYAEELLAFWFANAPHAKLHAYNLPVFSDGQTLGAADFVVSLNQQPYHIELACKYYGGDQVQNLRGLNPKAPLTDKAAKLVQQSQLLHTPQGKATLTAQSLPENPLPASIVRGIGFFPQGFHAFEPPLNPYGWRGIYIQDWAEYGFERQEARYHLLDRMAYLAPAIGPDAFEVGQDVFDAFCTPMPEAVDAFEDIGGGKYLADIYALARMVLHREGVNMIYGGTHCTVLERDTFFSYRRDGQTGRMVSLIWLEK